MAVFPVSEILNTLKSGLRALSVKGEVSLESRKVELYNDVVEIAGNSDSGNEIKIDLSEYLYFQVVVTSTVDEFECKTTFAHKTSNSQGFSTTIYASDDYIIALDDVERKTGVVMDYKPVIADEVRFIVFNRGDIDGEFLVRFWGIK